MNESWLVLTLYSKTTDLNILSSYFDTCSLGSHDCDEKINLYFDFSSRHKVESILENINVKYKFEYDWSTEHKKNWMENWKDFFTPVSINNEVIIIPDWDEKTYNHKYKIKLCPAMAFGTGHHESTQLIIQQMLYFKIHKYDSLLDLGAGSGILSILAKKMGLSKITSIDNDPVCMDNFNQNCSLSDVSGINFLTQDVHEFNDYNYDIILANIDKNNIIKILKKYQKNKTTARLILAGLLDINFNEIKENIGSCIIENHIQKGEWISISVKK